MSFSDEDVTRILVNGKKEYSSIKKELGVSKKGESELKDILARMEEEGLLIRESSGETGYYKLAEEPKKELISASMKETALAVAIIMFFTAVYVNLFLSLHQIPGPLYGGDYYTHYGIINHIYNGNAPWTCPQNQNEYAFYPWLVHVLVAFIGKITGNLLASFLLYFPTLVVIASGIIVYFLGKELFKDKVFPLVFTFVWMGTRLFVDYIPASFTPTITTPLLLLTVLKAIKTGKKEWTVSAAVSFGLFIMSHMATLPPGALLLIFVWLYYSFAGNVRLDLDPDTMRLHLITDRAKLRASLARTTKIVIPIAVIGFIIGLLYWGPVFAVYGFGVKNTWADYTMPDYQVYGAVIAKELVIAYLFNIDPLLASGGSMTSLTNGLKALAISSLTLIGLLGAIKNRKETGSSFLALAFATGFFGYLHYLFTVPLLGTNYSPLRIENFMLNPAAFILMVYGVYMVYNYLKTRTWKKAILALAIIFFALNSYEKISGDYDSQWTKVGQRPETPQTVQMADWVKANTDKNAVFLSTEELSFALNALTGRKLVVDRRTHSNPFVDINERMADSLVMLQGNNGEKALQLLKYYNVSYVYWDSSWQYISSREPSMVPPEYKEYLNSNGVTYQEVTTYLDPAWSERYKKYQMLAVFPGKDALKPWGEALDKHLKLEFEAVIDGTPVYRIYSIDYQGAAGI